MNTIRPVSPARVAAAFERIHAPERAESALPPLRSATAEADVTPSLTFATGAGAQTVSYLEGDTQGLDLATTSCLRRPEQHA